MQTLDIDLGDRSYPIYIGSGTLNQADVWTQHLPSQQVMVVTNATIAEHYLAPTLAALSHKQQVETVILPDGEQYKTFEHLNQIFDALLEHRFDRHCALVALGGGVVGDMTGFAAASYQRGVKFVQIPTTLLAQVDSSVGGKTAINHPRGKNMIGAFYQPQCVVIDTDTLNTLPDRELSAGLAEVIKYGAIMDAEFFDCLEANAEALYQRDTQALTHAIQHSCACKAQIVAEDEKEAGRRALLNFGHTFGHAIETGMGYGSWLHGEAVATGMCLATAFSQQENLCDADILPRLQRILSQWQLPIDAPQSMSAEEMLDHMGRDKKVQAGQIRLVLLRSIGDAFTTAEYSEGGLKSLLEHACGDL